VTNTAMTPMELLRVALRIEWPQNDLRCYDAKQRVAETLLDYAKCRNADIQVEVLAGDWEGWHWGDEDHADDYQFVVGLDVTKHVPPQMRPANYPVAVNRRICGTCADFDGLALVSISWGKTIIDRVAKATALVHKDTDTSWSDRNCRGKFHLTPLDPDSNPHEGLSGEEYMGYCPHVTCLSFDDPEDAVLYKLRWF
jgi:hypothetical protein